MSGPTIIQNPPSNDPHLKDLLDLLKKDIFLNLNCHHIGTIQSFNATNQTVTATINYKKTFFQNTGVNQFKPVLLDYPLVIDCPAIVMGGGSAYLTMPISAGDECLILFNDRDLDNWFQSGGGGAVATPRLHSFADGIALIGLHSLAHSIANYDSVRATLRGGNAKVAVNPTNDKVLIENNSKNLNTLLQDLITAIKNITVSPGSFMAGGDPVTGVSGTPVNASTFTTLASDLGDLLE